MMSTEKEAETQHSIVHQRIDKMTRALRVLGALLLLTSASSFLVHRWEDGQDLLRFVFLLCHSFVVLGAALFCGGRLGESRSARVFLWTNMALIPAHFAVLGGLVYSQFPFDPTSLKLPAYAVWEAPSKLSVFLATIGTYVTVVATGLISARVLVPRRGLGVTLLFVGLCSLLLVPFRDSNIAALLAATGALGALWFDRKRLAPDFRMRTLEGRMVRSLLAVPSVLLVARAAIFYPTTTIFSGVLIVVASGIGFVLSQTIKNNSASVEAGEWLSTLGACTGLVFVLDGSGAFDALGSLTLCSCSVVALLASRFSLNGRAGFEAGAAISAVAICALALVSTADLASGVMALLVGAAALAYALLMARALIGVSAVLCTLGGTFVLFDQVIGFEHLGSWGMLSLLGLFAVLAAALLERHRDVILNGVLRRFASEGSRGNEVQPAPSPRSSVNFPPRTQAPQV